MRKYVILILILLFIHCKEGSHADHSKHSKEHYIAAGSATSGSLFDLESVWESDKGNGVNLKSLHNSPFLISMFYTSCNSVCPRLVSDIVRLQEQIQKKTGKLPQIVLVSFDPETDTISNLKVYREKRTLGDNWLLLRGKEDDTRMLAVSLGINYKKLENGDFNHSVVISLASNAGIIVSRVEGIEKESNQLLETYYNLVK